tara:strand:- start:207 stop:413 length:207 start_codon:yes stop_codon:yes gene_type:complete
MIVEINLSTLFWFLTIIGILFMGGWAFNVILNKNNKTIPQTLASLFLGMSEEDKQEFINFLKTIKRSK